MILDYRGGEEVIGRDGNLNDLKTCGIWIPTYLVVSWMVVFTYLPT